MRRVNGFCGEFGIFGKSEPFSSEGELSLGGEFAVFDNLSPSGVGELSLSG